MANIINVSMQMLLGNEMAKVYYSSNLLTSFQDFSSDYMNKYNSARMFLNSERENAMQKALSFETFENGNGFLSSMSNESLEQLAVTIVGAYYSSGYRSSFNEFVSDFLYNYSLTKQMLRTEIRKEEQLRNSFEGFENSCDAVRLLNNEGMDHLSIQIVNTYYSTHRLGDFKGFAEEYINNYKLSSNVVKNNNEEISENAKKFH